MNKNTFDAVRLKELRAREASVSLFLLRLYRFSNLKISRQTLHKWESGKSVPNATQLGRLADYFELNVSEFFEAKKV